jgi:hypothetical protein
MESKNVFEGTVETLINDVQALQKKLSKLQENNDFRGAIDCMRLLKDSLSLIKEYDWELMYSEYKTVGGKQVSVWEQNHCGEIKNHKVWDISNSKPPMYINYNGKEKVALYFNKGVRMMSYEINENGYSPLINFLKSCAESYDIYVDIRGFGKMIADLLDTCQIKYSPMTYGKIDVI